jgi:integral membrane protein
MILHLLKTKIGRLRLIGYLEGISLLVLVFVAVPMKYGFANPSLTKLMGPTHGAIFLLFLINALSLGVELNWKFRRTTLPLLLSCFVPFGTFYVDRKILSKINQNV